MTLELDGSYAKLDWADKHLDELQRKLATGMGDQPYRVRSEFYPEADVLVGRLIVPIPLIWGVMTGNIIHNARSALDYMIRQLVKKAGNVPKDGPGGNQFPIFDARPDGGFTRRVRNSMLAGVADADRAAIKRLQPYITENNPDSPRNPLRDLAALSNVDKHQDLVGSVLNPLAGHRVSGRLRFSKSVREVIDHHITALTTLKDGTVFAWAEVVRDGSTEPKMYVDGNMTLQVGLSDGRNLGGTLRVVLHSTRTILDAFAAGRAERLQLGRVEPLTVVLP